MQKSLFLFRGALGLSLLLSACIKKNASVQASSTEQESFLEVSEEPTALPLLSLIRKLRENVVNKTRMKPGEDRFTRADPPPYVACGQTLTIPGTQICMFTEAKWMNYALNRTSQWVEAKELVDHKALAQLNSRQNVGGHNLSGKDLKSFAMTYAQVKDRFDKEVPPQSKSDSSDELLTGLGVEREFWSKYLQKKVDSSPNFYLLAVTLDSYEALDHEVLHALYYSSPKMQELVTEYWLKDLPLWARQDIIADLAYSGAYNVGNDNPEAPSYLLLQEFQAYALMRRSEDNVQKFNVMAKQFGPALKLKLTQNGIELPETNIWSNAP